MPKPRCEECDCVRGVKPCHGDRMLCTACNKKLISHQDDCSEDEGCQSNMAASITPDILHQLTEISGRLKKLEGLQDDVKSAKTGTDEIKKSIAFMNTLLETFKTKIHNLERDNRKLIKENEQLRERTSVLETTQDDLDQYIRRDNLELHGIPEYDDESTDDIAFKVLKCIDNATTLNDIDITHRIGTKQQPGRKQRHRPIIVRFNTRSSRNNIYKKKKNLYTTTTKNIGFPEESTIYVNENLTPWRKSLFGQANRRKKERIWKYVWTNNGKILARKDSTSQVINIECEEDIAKII